MVEFPSAMIVGTILLFAASIITNASVLSKTDIPEMRFQVEGVVTFANNTLSGCVAIEDKHHNVARFANESDPFCELHPGDIIRASGRTAIDTNKTIRRNCKKIKIIGRQAVPPPTRASVKDLADGKMDNRFVTIEATLRDVFLDELDPDYVFFVLQDGYDTIISFQRRSDDMISYLHSIVGTRLKVTGVCVFMSSGRRVKFGRTLLTDGKDSFALLDTPPKDDFDVPGIDELKGLDPSRIAQFGRCRTVGTVIATWGRNKLLVKDNWARLTEVELSEANLPPCGIMVDVAGLPASNFMRINLLRAKWRHALGPPLQFENADQIEVKALFADERNRYRYEPLWHGRTIRIRGTVKAMTSGEYTDGRFFLESDSFMLPIDTTPAPSAIERVKVGYQVEVTGICIMEGENWSPYSAFPQIHGVLLVVRTPDDIRTGVRIRPSRRYTEYCSWCGRLTTFASWRVRPGGLLDGCLRFSASCSSYSGESSSGTCSCAKRCGNAKRN